MIMPRTRQDDRMMAAWVGDTADLMLVQLGQCWSSGMWGRRYRGREVQALCGRRGIGGRGDGR